MNPPADPALLHSLLAQALQLDPAAIDTLYGLEPVYEPEAGPDHAELCTDVEIDCPYCHAPHLLRIDLTAGRAQAYVEDCQVCCRPIAVQLSVDDAGALAALSTDRSD